MPPLQEIVVLDDHALFSQGLAQLLNSALPATHISICNTYEELEAYTHHHRPDVALLDIRLKNILHNGLDACRLLQRTHPRCIRIVCSAYSSTLYSSEAARCGAHAYLCKSKDPAVLLNFLQQGKPAQEQKFSILDGSDEDQDVFKEDKRFDLLTQREREILCLLGQQMSLPRIAEFLHISYDTAKTHRTHIMQKLQICSKEELYAIALQQV